MSKFAEKVRAPRDQAPQMPEWFEAVYSNLPEIACVLAGTPKGPGGEPAVPAMSIIIKDYQGRLQFTLSRKGSPDMWSGVIEDPGSLLLSLEAALQAGNYSQVVIQNGRAGHRPQF